MNKTALKLNIKMMLAMIAMIIGFSVPNVQANPTGIPEIPAFLPMAADVPMTDKLPIDGEWMINEIRKRIRIERGRAYAVDSWLHMFVLKIGPLMVVSKDWVRTGPGEYAGQDLPLVGPFTAKLTPSGSMNVNIQGLLGPVNLTFSPVRLDDQDSFESEKAGEDSYPEEDEDIEEDEGGDDDGYEDDYDDEYEDEYEDDEEDDFEDGGFEEGDFDEEEDEEFYDEEEEEEPRKVEALSFSRYSCKGKGLYYSKVNGSKGCYTCPDGMKRTSATRKMNHPKACVNRKGKNTYAKGRKLANLKKCKKGQFKHKGYCKACPEGTKRLHIAGLDSGYCKILD